MRPAHAGEVVSLLEARHELCFQLSRPLNQHRCGGNGGQLVSSATSYPVTATPISGTQAAQSMRRIRAEFDEMPGLCLTSEQASRLFAIAQPDCEVLLNGLVVNGVLRRTNLGYVRA